MCREKVQISYLEIRIIAYIPFLWVFKKDLNCTIWGRGMLILFRVSLVTQVVKESSYNAGDLDWIPGLGRSSGEGNGYPFQCSCGENFMDRGAWQATVHGVA